MALSHVSSTHYEYLGEQIEKQIITYKYPWARLANPLGEVKVR